MVEIRSLPDGRFEVFAEGRHHEAFAGTLGAIVVAQALAGEIAMECKYPVTITTPWGVKQVEVPASVLASL